MPGWNEIVEEIALTPGGYDAVRRKYLHELKELTGRNVIIYYSGWLEKADLLRAGVSGFDINDGDKNGFMSTIYQLDRSRGLDLLLHTPGGGIAATESIVDYLRMMFDGDVRAIVPQLALSAGTMIALSSKEIVMGKHSSLGPIDPQVGGLPAHGIVEEFNRAANEIAKDPSKIALWQPVIAKYNPTLVGECEKAIKWGSSMVKGWLMSGMLQPEATDDPVAANEHLVEATRKADIILTELADHAMTLSHDRHISAATARSIGLNVRMLEDDSTLQEAVLTLHHSTIQTLAGTAAIKIIENHNGIAHIRGVQVGPVPPSP